MKNAKLYLLVGALTLGNIAFRVASAESGTEPRPVSHLQAGDRVDPVELGGLLDHVAHDGTCRLVIAFHPDCPFCAAAAGKERLAARKGIWGKTLWVTDADRARLPEFVSALSSSSRHAVAPDLVEALDVEAVPALFMFDGQGTIRWVGPYGGDETVEELEARCDGAGGAVPTTSDVSVVSDG